MNIRQAQLPKGWEIKKLGEVCELINRGVSPKYIDDNGMIVLNQKCVREHEINFEPSRFHDATLKKVSEDKIIRKGDVLVNSTGTGTLGRVAQVREELDNVTVDSHITIVRPIKEIFYPDFFGWALILIEDEIASRGEGCGGQTELSRSTLKNDFIISYPKSLSEQQRIVAILDEAFAAIAKAKANAQQNLQNAKELFESYLQGVFENKVEGWEECNLEKYIKLIDYRGRTPVKKESGVRLITAKNVKLGYLQLEPQEFIAADNYDSWMSRGIPNFGDVIFTTEAPLANVAQIDTNEKLAFAQRIIVMQPKADKLDQTFLKYMLLSNPIRKKILDSGTGATVLGIKSSLLKKIEIPFPLLKTQQTIVQELDALSAETKKLETIYQQKINDLEELKKSVLQKAFSGELKTVRGEV